MTPAFTGNLDGISRTRSRFVSEAGGSRGQISGGLGRSERSTSVGSEGSDAMGERRNRIGRNVSPRRYGGLSVRDRSGGRQESRSRPCSVTCDFRSGTSRVRRRRSCIVAVGARKHPKIFSSGVVKEYRRWTVSPSCRTSRSQCDTRSGITWSKRLFRWRTLNLTPEPEQNLSRRLRRHPRRPRRAAHAAAHLLE